jgi:tetratricopeptide (TPR) repeat protein
LRLLSDVLDFSNDALLEYVAYKNIGEIYARLQKPDVARRYLTRADEIKPLADAQQIARSQRPELASGVARLAEALVQTEIKLDREKNELKP